MNIDITVQDYFEELKLMETQFEQEEDLYPWIYMILQMAECRKRDLLGPLYEGVSIRDIHNAGKARIKELAGSKTVRAVPDCIVIDIERKTLLGGIEIKRISESDLKINRKCYSIKALEPEYRLWFNCKDGKGYYTKISKNDYDKINSMEDFKVEVSNCKERQNIKIVKYIKGNEESTGEKKPEIELEKVKVSSDRTKSDKDHLARATRYVFKTGTTADEMVSHIKDFKKVLYTNGLQFCLFTLSSDGKKAGVTGLANLRETYEKYKEIDKNTTIIEKSEVIEIIKEASCEWNKLINALIDIDWHAAPTTEIPQND